MSKTIKNLKSCNYEVVDSQGVSITTHFIECLEKEFADLEAKLAESKRQANDWKQRFESSEERNKQMTDNSVKALELKNEKIKELKQQLAEKEKEIKRLKIYDEYRFELPYPKVKILGKTFEDIQELIDKWIKQGSKDKISFAVEQLEKVKRTFIDVAWEDVDFAIEIIDDQIKELKGEK